MGEKGDTSMKLDDRVAIVTGAANGIGREIALNLAREGAHVVVGDINLEQANEVVNRIEALGVRAIAVEADVSKSQEVNQMAKTTLDEFGKIDILVNNAGAGKESPFYQSTDEVMDWVIGVSLRGVMNCTQAVIEHMMQRRSGKIVSIASEDGMTGMAMLADYSAAKAGIIGFTKALAKELAPYGINVNSVAPGSTAAGGVLDLPSEKFDLNKLKQLSGLNRFAKPEEIATMVVFLTTEDASFITGQVFPVCGLANLGTY